MNITLRVKVTTLFLMGWLLASGQEGKLLHQSFSLDSIQELTVEPGWEYVIEPWAGSSILVETHVSIENASRAVMDHFLETGRYNLETNREGEKLQLLAVDKERRPIQTKKGSCYEAVRMKIFLPDQFERVGDNLWQRRSPGTE